MTDRPSPEEPAALARWWAQQASQAADDHARSAYALTSLAWSQVAAQEEHHA